MSSYYERNKEIEKEKKRVYYLKRKRKNKSEVS